MFLQALYQNPKWRVRCTIFAILIVPLYLVPCLARSLAVGRTGWLFSLIAADVIGSILAGFLTNNYRLGAFLYIGSTALELALMLWGHHVTAALWIGDLIPTVVTIYYAQQLYINMGD